MNQAKGVADPLREALASHAERIQAAFVYGSIAKGEDAPTSDVDLMVIGDDLTYADFFDGLLNAERELHRSVHASFVSRADWERKLAQGSAFFTKINAQPKIFLLGAESSLSAH